MRREERLKKEARAAAESRGHVLRRFEGHGRPYYYTAICRRCRAWVCVAPNPLPNEIDIGGPAVAVGCNG